MFLNRVIIKEYRSQLIKLMEPATVLSISIAAFVVLVTGMAVYTSFGPPSKELSDPFEDHED
jgi:PsbN protein